MFNGIDGQKNSQIKFSNGKSINLKKLDKLIGQSIKDSVFAKFDAVENGGNADSVFSEAEIQQIKAKLQQYQQSENIVSQDELNEMFGFGQADEQGNKIDFDVNKLTSQLDNIPDEEVLNDNSLRGGGTEQPDEAANVFTNYTVQPGDTPEKLAVKFGLEGEEVKSFINHLKTQTNKKGWFNVGQKITLLGNHSNALKNMDDYSEDNNVLQERWKHTEAGQRAIQAAEAQTKTVEAEPASKPEVKQVPKVILDKTPQSQREKISNVKAEAKSTAAILKDQIEGISINSKTRALLGEKVKNQNVAYILEEYPNLVNDINDEYGMDIKDIKQYIINPLNSRLRELGMNNHCIPNDLSKYDMKQIQKVCSDAAKTVRNTDAENGYVFKPTEGNEGKIHKPRKASQMQHYAGTGPKTVNQTTEKQSVDNLKKTEEPILLPGENSYPEEMQKFILEQRAKGIEYVVKAEGKEYTLSIDYTRTKMVNILEANDSVKFQLTKPLAQQADVYSPQTFGVDTPFNVDNKLQALLGEGKNAVMKKGQDGSYTIVQTNDEGDDVKSITYKYSANGDFQYQLNVSAHDQSVMIGKINKQTKQLEFKQFKNNLGILQQIPDNVSQKQSEMMMDGGKAKIIRGKETFTIVQTEGTYLNKNNIAKIEHKYSPFGVLIQQIYTYKNGRVAEYYNASAKGNDAAHVPNPIKITLPEQYQGKDTDSSQMIYGLETKGPKETAQRFANALESNKAQLMTSLRLTNEEYDNLAILAMGIAEQETHFGQNEYLDTKGGEHSQSGLTDRANAKYYANKLYWSIEEQQNHSQGITQINYSTAIQEPAVAKAFKEYGIDSFETLQKSPEKQAIATMIILKQNKNVAESATWQERLAKNNAKIKENDKKLTTNDVIALLWNGVGGVVKRMNDGEIMTIDSKKKEETTYNVVSTINTPDMVMPVTDVRTKTLNGTFYAKAVRTYADRFFASPATQKSGAMHVTNNENIAGALSADSQGNGGRLGEVVFMPKSYSNAYRTDSSNEQLRNAKEYINGNTQLSEDSKKLLQQYISDGLIGFGRQGLTQDEAMSINENDVKLITEQIDAIKLGKANPVQANSDFERNYLRSREFTVQNSSIGNSASILSATRSSDPQNSKIAGNLDFEIHKSFYLGGKGRHSARYSKFDDNANSNVFAVTESQGVNPYLSNGKVVQDRYRIAAEYADYTATDLFESGGRCKTGVAVTIEYSMGIDHTKIRSADGKSLPNAKDLVKFYSAHPEVFPEIKYVNNGDGTSRELNSTDVHDLPCGYFGVFTPGEGYENEAGHAFVSDGFGGAFADEHDNGKWAHFGNGKGEHGKLNVYGLSSSVVTVYSEKLSRKVNVPLNMNPWYLKPEFRELQAAERQKRGLEPLELKEEF